MSLPARAASQAQAIFVGPRGNDPRQAMLSTYPWSAIGRIQYVDAQGTLHSCTGTLVGKRVVLTAAHCVLNNQGITVKIEFAPVYANGKSAGTAFTQDAHLGTNAPDDNWDKDWAVLAIDQPLGTPQGYMDVAVPSPGQLPLQVAFAGYSGDFQAGQVAGSVYCHLATIFSNGAYGHDCSTEEGASGGPLFYPEANGRALIAAVNSRGYNGSFTTYAADEANIAVMSQDLVNTVQAFRQRFDF